MAYIGVSPSNGVRRVHTYTATASQTTFSGAGAEGTSLSYKDSNFVDVYQNGIKLGDADYTSTSGTSIVLAQGASVDDLVVVVVFDVFSVADTVSKADGGTFDGNVTMAGTLDVTGNGTVGGTLGVTGVVTANAGIKVDNITIDGSEIDFSSGSFTVDVNENITFDSDTGIIKLADGGTNFGQLDKSGNNLRIISSITDGDIVFRGDDGGSGIDALTLDMSDAGNATFNKNADFGDGSGIRCGASQDLQIYHQDGASNKIYGTTAHHVDIHTSNVTTPRIRIKDDGNIMFATTTSPASIADGASAEGFGYQSGDFVTIARTDGGLLHLNRLNSGGELVTFRQGGGAEGNISISGSTVSYNAFSGSHWSRLTDNSKPTILKGTVIETIDEMCDWYQVTFTIPATDNEEEYTLKKSYTLQNGQSVGDTITYNHDGTDYQATIIQEADNKHTKCKISDTADSTRVYGVFADWDNDDDTVNDMYVTAVGTHVVRVHSSATVSAGDLLVSNGDGTAKVQDDDIIRSKTIGKVLTNIKQETYDDGSYTVPCALYCG
jgi:hypothetical protein